VRGWCQGGLEGGCVSNRLALATPNLVVRPLIEIAINWAAIDAGYIGIQGLNSWMKKIGVYIITESTLEVCMHHCYSPDRYANPTCQLPELPTPLKTDFLHCLQVCHLCIIEISNANRISLFDLVKREIPFIFSTIFKTVANWNSTWIPRRTNRDRSIGYQANCSAGSTTESGCETTRQITRVR
jgi:hypothetical protein